MIEKPTQYLEDEPEKEEPIEQLPYTPDTLEESVRKSGLAYGAGAVLFGSVAVMFAAGWALDQYLGSSPKGIIGGIIIGAALGFYQFFRITSQIINKN